MSFESHDDEIEVLAGKDPGYLLTRDILAAGIPHIYLYDYLERHPEYVKMENGVFVDTGRITPDLFYIMRLHKKVVFSYMSACYLHGMTGLDVPPLIYEINLTHGYNKSRINSKDHEPGDGKKKPARILIEGKNLKVHLTTKSFRKEASSKSLRNTVILSL